MTSAFVQVWFVGCSEISSKLFTCMPHDTLYNLLINAYDWRTRQPRENFIVTRTGFKFIRLRQTISNKHRRLKDMKEVFE